jgi:hypothetical protein
VIGLNSSLSLLVTLLTPPDRLPILSHFYQTAQPLGAWGIVRKQIRNQAEPNQNNVPEDSGFRLILQGIGLALLGAVSVMLMVVGLSLLYVGRYGSGLGILVSFALGTLMFFRLYGPYLGFLEQRAPPTSPSSPSVMSAGAHTLPDQNEPVSTNLIVALATGGYGLLIGGGGLIWTLGEHLILNLMAGVAFLVAAGIVWLLGGPPRSQL